jgi:hypothetical protein
VAAGFAGPLVVPALLAVAIVLGRIWVELAVAFSPGLAFPFLRQFAKNSNQPLK